MKKRERRTSVGEDLKKGFRTILILFFVIYIFLFLIVANLLVHYVELKDNSFVIVNEISMARNASLCTQNSVYKMCISQDKEQQSTYSEEADNYDILVQKYLKKIVKMMPQYKKNISEIKKIQQDAFTFRSQAILLSSQDRNEDAINLLEENYFSKMQTIDDTFVSITDSINVEIDAYASNEEKIVAASLVLSLFMLGIIFFYSVTKSKKLIHSIQKPLEQVGNAMEEVYKGNLDFKLEYYSDNELGILADRVRVTGEELKKYVTNIDSVLGELSHKNFDVKVEMEYKGMFNPIEQSMKEIIGVLHNVMGSIFNTSKMVTSSACETSEIAKEMSDGATTQANAIEELILHIRSISCDVEKNAEQTKEVYDHSENVKSSIESSESKVESLVGTMSNMLESSQKIFEIISIIEEIAGQTNLLSFNAAIEAARAGSTGNGFHVVASEIKKLADSTTEAANRTKSLIDKSNQIVKEGNEKVKEICTSLEYVDSAVKIVSEKSIQVSNTSKYQAKALVELESTIQSISKVVQNNLEFARNVQHNSENLEQKSGELSIMMESFICNQS
ncbi:MAG: methyl-accepting chemotaxis protein [Lachnotalea sp.]